MIRTATRLIKYAITVSRIDHTPKALKKIGRIDFHPVVGTIQRKLGACILNQPANQNLLTEEFIDELHRFMISYQYDNTVENIWIESKNSTFSHGVDYKRLSEDPHYLDKVAKLGILFAKLNKPTFAHVSGGVRGAGAYLLSMINMPLGYTDATLKIDEADRGMVPLMGGSHRLSRLPLHLGFYLALTGDQLNSEEMTQLGFIKGGICPGVQNHEIKAKLEEANLYFREKFRYFDFDESKTLLEAEQRIKVESNKQIFHKKLINRQSELLAHPPRNLNIKFAVNQHLAASSDYHNATNPFNSFSDNAGQTINNYFLMRFERPLNYLKEHKLIETYDITGVKITRFDIPKIDFIFGKETLAEIMDALKEETSEWAQQAYNNMKKADPLALSLTFELLKRARSQPWINCVETEFAVARRLIENSTLKLRTSKNSSQYIFVNEFSHKTLNNVTPEVIQSYFTEIEGHYKFQHEVPSYSLHPYNDYFQELPDSVRTYLNTEKFVDKHLTEQIPEIRRFLRKTKINYGSKVFDIGILRKNVYQRLQLEKEKNLIIQRLSHLASNESSLKSYEKGRVDYLNSIDNAQLETRINDEVASIFKQKFENRYQQFEEKTANMAGMENKIALFKKIKEIIVNNIIYNGPEYEAQQKKTTLFDGPIYFDKTGKDIYNSVNTYILENEPLKQLSEDLSKGNTLSEEFLKHENEVLPKFFGTPDELMEFEKEERQNWAKIKFWYDDKPELTHEALIYKELIEQASRTSEELSGFMEWNHQNFCDLIEFSEKPKQNYGQFAADIVTEINSIRGDNIKKLKAVDEARQNLLQKGLFSPLYQLKEEEKMREVFPYYVNESTIPGEFRRSFLSVMDSTIKQFTSMYRDSKKKLLLKEELGILDRWINKDIATNYTDFLKHDVEYVSSYLEILFVKELLIELKQLRLQTTDITKIVEQIREKFNVDFLYNSTEITFEEIDKKVVSFLYFLVDMHVNSKKHIKSPQNKLLDFLNRLKTSYESDEGNLLPYSFEGLILLIGKDRKKIYDRFLGQKFVSEPEFMLQFITKQSKLTQEDRPGSKVDFKQDNDQTLVSYFEQQHDIRFKTTKLVQNYFYYMIQFENYIHQICGKESFIPDNFVSEEIKMYNEYCKKIISSSSHEEWLKNEIRAVVEQLLKEREIVQRKLTKGELYIYDQTFVENFNPEAIKDMIKSKIEEEIYLVRNMFRENRDYELEHKQEEIAELQYNRVKRLIKNPDALKKLNNLTISEQIYLDYMTKTEKKEDLSQAELRFAQNEKQYLKNGLVTRLPPKSYQRMSRDLFVHPEDQIYVPESLQETELFKKTNIKFSTALASDKINLSSFTKQYKQLNEATKNDILKEMVDKISKVESL